MTLTHFEGHECDMCSQFVCGSSEHFSYCVTSCMYGTSEVMQLSLRLCKFCVHCCKQLCVFFLVTFFASWIVFVLHPE